jgi:DNA-binding transcriptional regulator/RsmH inhibitor MraZ
MNHSWWLAGRYPTRVDAQGRLVLPRQFRRQIKELSGNELFVEAREGFLVVRSAEGFARLVAGVVDLDDESDEALQQRAELAGRLQMFSPDSQGRLKLPQVLLEPEWMQGELEVVGAGREFLIRPAGAKG